MGMRERERERDIGTNEDRTYFSTDNILQCPGVRFLMQQDVGQGLIA